MQMWIPLLVALVGLAGGAVIYQFQKAIDRLNQTKLERRDIYRRFVVTCAEFFHLLQVRDDYKTAISKLNAVECIIGEITVSAPDSVLEVMTGFSLKAGQAMQVSFEIGSGSGAVTDSPDDDEPDEGDIALAELDDQYDQIVLEMRKDTFENTVISRQVIESITEFAEHSIRRMKP